MNLPPEKLVSELIAGNRRALARVLSLLEDDHAKSEEILKGIYPKTGRAYVIGFTGSPGAGKSTLVDQCALELCRQGKKTAIVAVDPSSPFTGGALLGDRIRMTNSLDGSDVFIRSMASRGALGGLAPRTAEFIFALDAAGFDYILLETVGVGQGEVEVIRSSDCVVVTLVPGMGDGVQALKAGILEIADLFVINKADYDGADRLERELLTMLSLQDSVLRQPEIVRTVATKPTGISKLLESVDKYRSWATESGEGEKRRRRFLREALMRDVTRELVQHFQAKVDNDGSIDRVVEELLSRQTDPRSIARRLIQRVVK